MGKADITPPTGYIMLGWARGDARAMGQHTRLYAKAMVLRRGAAAARARLRGPEHGGRRDGPAGGAGRAGFDERDVIVQATHTHAGPTGYSNFLFKDRAFPTSSKAPKAVGAPSPTRASTRSWSAGWRWRSGARTRDLRPGRCRAGAARALLA